MRVLQGIKLSVFDGSGKTYFARNRRSVRADCLMHDTCHGDDELGDRASGGVWKHHGKQRQSGGGVRGQGVAAGAGARRRGGRAVRLRREVDGRLLQAELPEPPAGAQERELLSDGDAGRGRGLSCVPALRAGARGAEGRSAGGGDCEGDKVPERASRRAHVAGRAGRGGGAGTVRATARLQARARRDAGRVRARAAQGALSREGASAEGYVEVADYRRGVRGGVRFVEQVV